jgi:hypothetical protein
MRLLDQENTTLEDAGFQDDDSILAEIRSRYYDSMFVKKVFQLVKPFLANLPRVRGLPYRMLWVRSCRETSSECRRALLARHIGLSIFSCLFVMNIYNVGLLADA